MRSSLTTVTGKVSRITRLVACDLSPQPAAACPSPVMHRGPEAARACIVHRNELQATCAVHGLLQSNQPATRRNTCRQPNFSKASLA
jgi:hypothetical protein